MTASPTTRPDSPAPLRLEGRLDATTVPEIWQQARAALQAAANDRPFCIDATGVSYCDGAGLAMLLDLQRQPRPPEAPVEIRNLDPRFQKLLAQFKAAEFATVINGTSRPTSWPEQAGRVAMEFWDDVTAMVSFIGEATAALVHTALHPRTVRWRDVLVIAEEAGANALPIVTLLSALLGVILAFQSAMPMRQFGAEIYVADLLGLSILRELGPLMTAIILAGRSGAAFAAEIGTMKVNEELNALNTMGLDPMRFLVAPRILAGAFIAPLLAVFCDLVTLTGGALIMQTLNVPLVTFANELLSAVHVGDFASGLFKALVFGVLISGAGCLRGLQTRNGASAVGISATRAVVTSITLIVVADGLFAVLFYHLGI